MDTATDDQLAQIMINRGPAGPKGGDNITRKRFGPTVTLSGKFKEVGSVFPGTEGVHGSAVYVDLTLPSPTASGLRGVAYVYPSPASVSKWKAFSPGTEVRFTATPDAIVVFKSPTAYMITLVDAEPEFTE